MVSRHPPFAALPIVALFSLFLLNSRSVRCINPNEACPVFPQITANPNTVHTKESPMGQRPWVVLVWVSCPDVGSTTCEGSLIDEDWVITTARCFPCGADASVVVDIGLHYSDIRKEMMSNEHSNFERIGAYNVHIHPLYNKTVSTGNDIALIHLIKKVNRSFVVSMTDCNKKGRARTTGRNCMSAGWGTSSMTVQAMTDVYMGLWSIVACSSATGLPHDNMAIICAGAKLYSNVTSKGLLERVRITKTMKDPEDRESCHVQLGASLVISQPMVMVASDDGQVEIKCEWQLCGVLAHGMHCDHPDIPGRYTDICKYEDWIQTTIRIANGTLNDDSSVHKHRLIY